MRATAATTLAIAAVHYSGSNLHRRMASAVKALRGAPPALGLPWWTRAAQSVAPRPRTWTEVAGACFRCPCPRAACCAAARAWWMPASPAPACARQRTLSVGVTAWPAWCTWSAKMRWESAWSTSQATACVVAHHACAPPRRARALYAPQVPPRALCCRCHEATWRPLGRVRLRRHAYVLCCARGAGPPPTPSQDARAWT
mmetsp:Transcript_12184/g.51303  ORF Transcript_12184/g.51303 Transcript_12184/m.51303 type:complete len:200 (-) Transcript_12184:2001-2600(-)